jgi:SAM-dependent methyltransferase
MNTWMTNAVLALVAALTATGPFFLAATRGALLLRGLSPGAAHDKSHVYTIHSNMRLIKLVDFQPVISAILLFQYQRLVAAIVKRQALREAGRLLAPGGKLFLAEFHRPDLWVLRALSWTYFKVFEPLGLALWDTHDPLGCLEDMGGWVCERKTYFFGNFQVITATRP